MSQMEESEIPVNRKKLAVPTPQASRVSEEEKPGAEDCFKKIRTAHPERVNRYLLRLGWYFAGVLAVCAAGRPLLSLAFADGQFADFHKARAAMLAGQQSILHIIFNSYVYQVTSIGMGLVDFVVQAICIVTILTPEDAAKVAHAQKEMQLIMATTSKVELKYPGSAKRKLLIDNYQMITSVMGGKNFRVKIMKLEFLKECFTLNCLAAGLLYLLKIGLREEAQIDQLELVLDLCLTSFLLYKNIIYTQVRLGQRPELANRRVFAICIYAVCLAVKLWLLLEAIHIVNNVLQSCSAVLLTALVYFCANKLNDLSVINKVRVMIFMLLYSNK